MQSSELHVATLGPHRNCEGLPGTVPCKLRPSLAPRHLIFLADGRQIDIGVIERVASDVAPGGDVVEFVGGNIGTTVFRTLANATTLEEKLGFVEFSVAYEKRESWRRLLEVKLDNP